MVEQDGRIELRQEKLNRGRKAKPITLTWSDTGVLVPGENAGARLAADLIAAEDAKVVCKSILAALESGIDVPASRTGPYSAFRVLQTFPELARHFTDTKSDKDRFWAAIGRLQSTGQVTVESYADQHRHQRKRLKCVNASMCVNDNDAPQGARQCAGGVGDERAQASTQPICQKCGGEGCDWCQGDKP
jgi:hypothetical protein